MSNLRLSGFAAAETWQVKRLDKTFTYSVVVTARGVQAEDDQFVHPALQRIVSSIQNTMLEATKLISEGDAADRALAEASPAIDSLARRHIYLEVKLLDRFGLWTIWETTPLPPGFVPDDVDGPDWTPELEEEARQMSQAANAADLLSERDLYPWGESGDNQ